MAAVSEHGAVKTEPPKSDLGLTTQFERNAIPLLEQPYGGARRLTRNLGGAEDLVQDTIGECRAQQAKVNR
ncbi:MAG: polymerase subunit sigma [Mycobacterium sp.]|nr:polymerase subunit sigma [Mycobacterium sp.]